MRFGVFDSVSLGFSSGRNTAESCILIRSWHFSTDKSVSLFGEETDEKEHGRGGLCLCFAFSWLSLRKKPYIHWKKSTGTSHMSPARLLRALGVWGGGGGYLVPLIRGLGWGRQYIGLGKKETKGEQKKTPILLAYLRSTVEVF